MQDSRKVLSLKTNRKNLYKVYLTSINGILKLTAREIEVFAKFYHYMELLKEAVSDNKMQNELLFSVKYKKQIRKDLDMSPLLLNNYVSSLKKKGFIKEVEGNNFLNESFFVKTNRPKVEITFNFIME